MGIMENLLKVISEHVRKMHMGTITTGVLGMVYNCRNVTHLISEGSPLEHLISEDSPLECLLAILKTMPQLQNLKVVLNFVPAFFQIVLTISTIVAFKIL